MQLYGEIALKCLYCYCGHIVNSCNVFKLRKSNEKLKKPKKNINCLVFSVGLNHGLNQWLKLIDLNQANPVLTGTTSREIIHKNMQYIQCSP